MVDSSSGQKCFKHENVARPVTPLPYCNLSLLDPYAEVYKSPSRTTCTSQFKNLNIHSRSRTVCGLDPGLPTPPPFWFQANIGNPLDNLDDFDDDEDFDEIEQIGPPPSGTQVTEGPDKRAGLVTLATIDVDDETDLITKNEETEQELPLTAKERASLTYQYGITLQEEKKSIKKQTRHAPYKIPYVLNKTSRIRIGCKQYTKYKTRKILSDSETEFERIRGEGQRRQRIAFDVLQKPIHYNRASKIRYLYTHLPFALRTRYGRYENYPEPPLEEDEGGSIDSVEYEIEEVRYHFKKPKTKVNSSYWPHSLDGYKKTLQNNNINDKRVRERMLKVKRARRLMYGQKLPFVA